jgi:hypothetical protein
MTGPRQASTIRFGVFALDLQSGELRKGRVRIRLVGRNFWPSGKAAGFPGPMPGESSAVPTEDGVGPHYLEASPPAGPASVQHNPQEPVAAVEAQATRRVLLENGQLVAKREDLRPQGSTGSKTGGY